MDGVMTAMIANTIGKGVALNIQGEQWEKSLFCADDALLLDQKEGRLLWLLTEICNVGKRRNLSVTISDSKVMVFEKNKNMQCRITMNEQITENIRDFKSLRSIFSKYGDLASEVEN